MNEPLLGERELELVSECVRTGWVSSAGRYIREFEDGWARYCGRRYGIACTNGTAALQLALGAFGLSEGDEVIIPTFTIISCALAVIYNGAVPVLVDADPNTWCMDVGKIEEAITPRTRAIMAVHIYGHPVDMDPLLEIAERHGVAVIEDAAEAHGAEYLSRRNGQEWQRCGSFGAASCFSFYANKLVTTGEGGMVVTDDDDLATRARSLRNLCFEAERRFHHQRLGFNFRMTNVQAALGVAQLERIEEIISRKRRIAELYDDGLRDLSSVQRPPSKPYARNVYWMYGLVLADDAPLDAAGLARSLSSGGIETRPFFLGMHEQPALRERGLYDDDRHPVAERISRRGLYLPSGLAMSDNDVDRVCAAMNEALT